ncbi:ATP-grasp ribosomal peptide maturase [Dictyobacter alpinus]|uniref:ATP-grasp ribosomal peptide maturase n=1 Tax=Dictyobacter alpinus TaxID=2014873 RepID=A0A402BDH1_9CHLR|nr:hypothetical protein [Dictyobacter alpinus]GCE29453.1 ATP-grasp ribosomal peptide maturase [Dictyobacter alpinus]
MKQNILIVAEEFEPHTDILLGYLRSLGHNPIRLHTADFPLNASVEINFDGQYWHGYLQTKKRRIFLEEIRSIWWRRPGAYVVSSELPQDQKRFVREELDHALKGVWYSLDCYWMSFPPSIRLASNKPRQLKQAAELGLRVPQTLITMDPDQAQAFFEACNESIIYKTLVNPQPNSDVPKSIYATPITKDHMTFFEQVRTTPCLFQEYIPKQVELRVTVIGDEVFTAEIHSQENERTKYDWRHYEVPTRIQKHTLPVDIAEKCIHLTKNYGLNFSTSDLILTPEGEYVFLETNPNGQWLWVEEAVPELKMKEALAECLIRGANG